MSHIQTHFSRVRTDFEEDRAQCLKRREHDHRFEKPPCHLPNECKFCHQWVCNACEETVSWGNGGGETMNEGGGLLCDSCWVKFIKDWLEAEEGIEREKQRKYRQALAL